MKEWFLTVSGEPFTPFGTSHLLVLLLYLAGACLLIYFHREIKTNSKLFQWIRWVLFCLLIISEVSYQIWTAYHGIWLHNLPFHLCGVAGIIGALALLTLNHRLIAVTFFIALIPAFLALLTPETPYEFPNFRFFKFFIHHIAISLTGLFFAVTSRHGVITGKRMIETYLYLVAYALFVGFIINPWLDANYLYLSHPPEVASPLDWFGSGIWYRLNLGIVCFLVFTLQYLGYRWWQRSSP